MIKIRKAVPEDAADAAALLDEAAHGFIQDIMGRHGITMQEKIFPHHGGYMNYRHCFLAEINGRNAGIMMAYSGARKSEGNFKNTLLFLRYINLSLLSHLKILLRSDKFPAFNPREDDLYLHGIAVYPEFRGRGIGTDLLAHLDSHAEAIGSRSIMLAAETSNEGAIELYKRCGYFIDGDSNSFQTKEKRYHFYCLRKNLK